MRTETKQFFTKFIAGAILLGVIVFLLFFVVKGVRAHDNESQKYYDNRKFDGNYPAKQIRELWMVCSATFQKKQPQLPQVTRWEVCDCYTDVIRESLSPEEVSKIDYEEAKKLTVRLIEQCNGKIDKPPIMT